MEASARAPEDLYGLPLEEFTPARDALAKELKAAGRNDEAAGVRSLRKPALAAWALNRTARDHPGAIERLRAAGAGLRVAQEEALSGDAGRLRNAGRTLADEIDRVAGLAADALRSAGRPVSAAQRDKLAGTLRTAAVDDVTGEILARGVLVDDLDPTGFSLLAAFPGEIQTTGPSSGGGRSPASGGRRTSATPAEGDGDTRTRDGGRSATLPGSEPKPKRTQAAREALEAVEAARRELRRCDAEADQATTRARRKAERAEAAAKRAAEAQREADEARSVAEDATGEAEAARRRAQQAAAVLAAAEAALDA